MTNPPNTEAEARAGAAWSSPDAKAKHEAYVPKPRRALKPDAQPFDRITIETVPRYKESGLSGDEWRISATVTYYRNGVEVHSFGCRNVETGARLVDARLLEACDDGKAYFAGEGDFCDQEGCSNTATWRHTLKAKYDRSGNKSEPLPPGEYRLFCDRHKTRGDCGLDDADSNYLVEPFTPETPQ